MTFLDLFSRAYLSPQEISVEASVPLEVVYRLRTGRQVSERDVRRVLRVVNSNYQLIMSLFLSLESAATARVRPGDTSSAGNRTRCHRVPRYNSTSSDRQEWLVDRL